MTVSLTEKQECLVKDKLERGLYASANDVISESLRLLDERDQDDILHLNKFQNEINVGFEELRRGELIPGEQVFAELEQISAARRKAI